MAVAARKLDNERRYSPAATRVYTQGAAAPVLLPQQTGREPAARPAPPPAKATRIARAPQVRPKVSAGRLMLLTLGIMAGAALMILSLVRYAMISQEYAVVNDTRRRIEESGSEITALKVQLNAAVSLEQARAAALAAGMGYPKAEQIFRITGTGQVQSGGQTAPE